jgi:hypothetical protein
VVRAIMGSLLTSRAHERWTSARGFFPHALPLGSASDLLHLCAEVLDAPKTRHGRCYGLGFVRAASALRTVFGSRAITRR